MCEFCDYYHSPNGGVSGKPIKINKCANETDLTDCQIMRNTHEKPSIVIFSVGMAKGYFDIAYCPACGRKLSEVEENEPTAT